MLRWDLQRFAQEKTEKATPQRRRDARREGRIARSADVTAAAALLGALLSERIWAPSLWDQLQGMMTVHLGHLHPQELDALTVAHLMRAGALDLALFTAPVLLAAVALAAAAGFAQAGWLFVPKLLLPDLKRVSPVSGLRRIFSGQTLWQLCRSLLKVAAAVALAWSVLQGAGAALANLGMLQPTQMVPWTSSMAFRLALWISAAFALLAVADYAVERFRYERSLRMSRDELREELRRTEGDPLVRSRFRQRARQLAMRRMIQDVRKADVVVTNPTHYAVALRYDARSMAAPTVVGKGQGVWAQRIRDEAREAGVPVLENPPLARTLYRTVEVGAQIPPELYRAVAEVLAYAYRLTGRLPHTRAEGVKA